MMVSLQKLNLKSVNVFIKYVDNLILIFYFYSIIINA